MKRFSILSYGSCLVLVSLPAVSAAPAETGRDTFGFWVDAAPSSFCQREFQWEIKDGRYHISAHGTGIGLFDSNEYVWNDTINQQSNWNLITPTGVDISPRYSSHQ